MFLRTYHAQWKFNLIVHQSSVTAFFGSCYCTDITTHYLSPCVSVCMGVVGTMEQVKIYCKTYSAIVSCSSIAPIMSLYHKITNINERTKVHKPSA